MAETLVQDGSIDLSFRIDNEQCRTSPALGRALSVRSNVPARPLISEGIAEPRGGSHKRVLDVLGAVLLLLLTSPVFLLLIVILRMTGGEAFYRHSRVGFGGKPFACLKFRSMVADADRVLADHLARDPNAAERWAERRKLDRDPRVTRLGWLLRKSSLDEIPQLLNVLRGDMSLVGPRPVMRDELSEHYGPEGTAAYVAVRPGITGLWQVSGRSRTSYGERVQLDIDYTKQISTWTDLRILLRTIPAVLMQRGAI